jgi:hypothetical protein
MAKRTQEKAAEKANGCPLTVVKGATFFGDSGYP